MGQLLLRGRFAATTFTGLHSEMTRGLQEALEHALAVQPDLLEPEFLRKRFPALVRKCIVSANDVRIGLRPERDLIEHIWGKVDVPRSTILRLFSRTQRELELITLEATPDEQETITQLPWMPVLHLFSAGVTAYVAAQDYRARERLSSTISVARDGYMLPIAISSGVLLMLHTATHDKPSKMLRTRDATRKTIDSFLDCWEWLSIYAELLSYARRKYNHSVRRPRIAEISSMLTDMLEGGLRDTAPQAQMIAALCAYIIGQFEDNASTIVQWADVYKRSSMAVDRTSRLYHRTSLRMYVRAYITSRQYANVIPIIEQVIAEEYSDASSRRQLTYTSYVTWLCKSLMAEHRYSDAIRVLDDVSHDMMKRAPENVRLLLITYRAIARSLADATEGPFDRRLLRVATLRNESSSRRASQHAFRLGALFALLLHVGSGATASGMTMKDIADKMLMMLYSHKEIRNCARTSAFIRIVAVMEGVEHISVAQVHRSLAVKRQRAILAASTSTTDFEIAPYEDMVEHVFGQRIRELDAPVKKPSKTDRR